MFAHLSMTRAVQGALIFRYVTLLATAWLLARLGIARATIGEYELLMYLGTTLSFFWVNAFLQGFLTHYPTQNTTNQRILIFQTALFLTCLAAVVALVCAYRSGEMLAWLTHRTTLPFVTYYAIFLLGSLPAYLSETILQVRQQSFWLLCYAVVSNVGQMCALLLPLLMHQSFEMAMLGLMIWGIVRGIFLWILVLQLGAFRSDNLVWQPYFRLCLPLMGYALLNGLAAVSDGWVVGWWSSGDAAMFAIFRFGAREFPFLLALSTGLSSALVPQIAANLGIGLVELKVKSQRLQLFWFPIMAVLLLVAQPLFRWVFGENFWASSPIFAIYLLLTCSRLLFSQTVLLGLGDTWVMLWISVIETIFNIGLSIVLVQIIGLQGIALATVLAFLFEKILIVGYLNKKYHLAPTRYMDVWTYLCGTFALLTIFVVQYFLYRSIF
jgi:O-antigen/teichoic acid export membrane protein